jgi:valyl-tRNA synthetase
LLRAFAPFLPYVTEEVWSWWREGSIHRSVWPEPDELKVSDGADPDVYEVAAEVLTEVRKAKALAKVSLKVPARHVTVHAPAERLAKLGQAADDLREAGGIQDLQLLEADDTSIDIELGDAAA